MTEPSKSERYYKSLAQLRERDPDLKRFGASHHRYALNPVLPPEKILAFEARYEILLPDEYRRFLLTIGDGGAGPCYGILSLEEAKRELFAGPSEPSLSRPFIPPQTMDAAKRMDYPADGILPLAEIGCGSIFILIVTGSERGSIWSFNNDGAYRPFTAEVPRYPADSTVEERLRINDEFDEQRLAGTQRKGFWEWNWWWIAESLSESSD